MGYLLKEALKSICGVNQWSYAVFWKIGSQNPKLLIWEDCYYEVMPGSALPSNNKIGNQGLTLEELDKCFLSSEAYPKQLGPHVGERVDLLVKKMMANQVHVVGEGLVGRTVFTGNHQWIVSGHFNVMIHPPEVINEVQLQFSSGMQTVAIIPATPHGVIQLGSSLAITENTGFIHDVKNLILHLGCIPSALVSDNYMKDVSVEQSRMPFTQVVSASLGPYGDAKMLNYSTASDGPVQPNLFQDSQLGVQATHSLFCKVQGNLKTTASTFPIDNHNPSSQGNENPDPFLNWHTSYNPDYGPNQGQSLASTCNHSLVEKHLLVGAGYEECTQHTVASGSVDQPHLHSQFLESYDGWTSGAQVGENFLYKGLNVALHKERDHVPSSDILNDFNKIYDASEVPSSDTALSEINSAAQGDLFDVLGMDFKNKFLNGPACEFSSTAGEILIHQMKSQDLTSIQYPNNCTISECGEFSVLGSDHMLDAMVSGVHSAATQTSDDNVSCKTTLTKVSCSSAPDSSLMFCVGSISQQMCELFGSSKTLARSSDIGASLTASSLGKSDTRSYSQTSSFYGSHSSSWVEQGPTVKHETSIATANSKKSGEVGKQTRKRLKPGENPRPRPKDRQMIQDRVKELREIVPNGAKCSIDALLERTIKHMLFLQSVTHHADKLKQTVDSKIINKDGGLLLKDSFEGGATWAYEVGSQANVYPIVVEDLNAPRQLLVEMLCEERGFFLEIADIIRGMGLTILKGVMETRQDKIWARFAVEANRDVTRMEVFLSLVRLLEQTGKIDKCYKSQQDSASNC